MNADPDRRFDVEMRSVESQPQQPAGRPVRGRKLPERYSVTEREKDRVLTCVEAPTLYVRVERGLTVTAAAVRKSTPGTIYLDGAAQGEPFIDGDKQVFNLDHHEGCVRSFTLATCEQAMVLVRRGLNLRERDFTIFANEPDLDTVFAIWVLLNHIRLNDENPEIRSRVMPLVRLQGIIDAHGLEMQELSGFPPRLLRASFAHLERLRAREVQLKKGGEWQEVDYLDYTFQVLREIDSLVYSSQHFQGQLDVEELARATISDRWLVIACRSHAGIYEVEQHLRRLHGERLGIIALQKDPTTYTLRRVNYFLPVSLDGVYEQLNLADPDAGGSRSGNRWGGSGDIGGSPRNTGTHLTAQQIVEVCAQAYRRPTRFYRFGKITEALFASATVLAAAVIVIFFHGVMRRPFPSLESVFLDRTWMFAAAFGGLSLIFLLAAARHGPGYYGIRGFSGLDWVYLLPAALVSSLAGSAWFPAALYPGMSLIFDYTWDHVLISLTITAAAELLFRGLIHTLMARGFRVQKSGGRWFLSVPAVLSSFIYTGWALVPYSFAPSPSNLISAAGVFILAISCAMARERSESLIPPVLIHWICLLAPILISGRG